MNSTIPLPVYALPQRNQLCNISFVSATNAITGWYDFWPLLCGLYPTSAPSWFPYTPFTVESTSIHMSLSALLNLCPERTARFHTCPLNLWIIPVSSTISPWLTSFIIRPIVVSTGISSHPAIFISTSSAHTFTICTIEVAPAINPITTICMASTIWYCAFAPRSLPTASCTRFLNNNFSMKVSTGSNPACTVNPFPFISVLIFGCLFSSFCAIFFIEKVNLLLVVLNP